MIIVMIIVMIAQRVPSLFPASSFRMCLDCEVLKGTVSFHNFKSQTFKLSVSNSRSKYVAYVSVLSQISNCQSLGRKNKHEILKTDRMFPWRTRYP